MADTLSDLVIKMRADFGDVASQLDGIATVAKNVGSAAEEAGKAIDSGLDAKLLELEKTGMTLGEAMAALGSSLGGIAGPIEAAGAAATEAATQLGLFDEAASVPFADAAGQLNMFATELEAIGPAADAAAAGAVQFSEGAQALIDKQAELESNLAAAQAVLEEVQKAYEDGAVSAEVLARAEAQLAEATAAIVPPTEEAETGLAGMAEKLMALGEALVITEGLKEFGQEALGAADNIKRAEISLTALTGSGEKAKTMIEEIEKLGIQDGLALPGLLQAAQRMENLLGSAAPVPELLSKIANGAAVMGTSIGAAANSFDRLATSGALGARQLMPLGLTLDKVAEAMKKVTGNTEVTAANVAKMFKAMDEGSDAEEKTKLRTEVLTTALEKLDGVAQKTAESTFGGQWQILANQWEQVMADVGKALLPVISNLTDLMKVDVLPFLKDVSEWFSKLPAPVKDTAIAFGLLAAAIVPVTFAIGGFGIALGAASGAIAPVGFALATLGEGIAATGASYGALVASGFFVVGMWVALAASIVEVAYAYLKMEAAEKLSDKSIADASKSLQEYELRLKQHGIDISEVKKQYDAGQISIDDYKKKLDELREAYLKTHPVSQEHVKDVAAVADISAAAATKMASLSNAVTTTYNALAKAQAQSKGTAADVQKIASAYDQWKAATNALKAAQDAHLPVISNLQKATHDYVATTEAFPSAEKAAADSTAAVSAKINEEAVALGEAQRHLSAIMDEYAKMKVAYDAGNVSLTTWEAMLKKVATAEDLVASKQKALMATMGDMPKVDWKPITDGAIEAAKDLKTATENANTFVTSIQHIRPDPAMRDLTSLLHDMGIQVSAVGDLIQNKLIKDYQQLGTMTHTLDEEDAAWGKVNAQVDKLAKTNLPAALKLYDEHYAQMKALGATEGELLALDEKRLQMVISIDEQTGKSATNQIVGLEMVKLKQQALYDQTHMMGDMYVGMIKDVLQGWDELGKSIADNIIEEGKWGDVFINVGKNVGKMIMEELVGTYFKALKNAILGVDDQTNKLGSDTMKLGSIFKSVFGGGNGSAPAGAPGVTDAASVGSRLANQTGDGTSSAAKNATQTISGGGGGALGIVDAVTGVAQLISSIIGNFQMAKLETTMNAVEHNTRFLQIEAEKFFQVDEWDRFNSLLNKLDDMWNSLKDIVSAIQTAGISVGIGGGGTPTSPNTQAPSNGSGGIQFSSEPTQPWQPVTAASGGGSVPVPVPASGQNPSPVAGAAADLTSAAHAFASSVSGFSHVITNIPQYERGGYVPYDMMANLDAGEVVVPRGAQTTKSSSQMNTTGPITINVNGAQDPRETSRQIANYLKNLSPRMSQYAT